MTFTPASEGWMPLADGYWTGDPNAKGLEAKPASPVGDSRCAQNQSGKEDER